MSLITLDRKTKIPKYRQIIQSIEIGISEGRIKKGDKLPSVNTLRNKFNISRDTVFLAFGELKERGIIEAVTGKGYYVISEDVTIKKKVFLLFDELNSFKEELYNSFIVTLNKEIQVDIYFHHFNRNMFDKLITDNIGNYSYYIIMPANLEDITASIMKLPKEKVCLLDQTNDELKAYSGVFQNFESNVYNGLLTLEEQILKYQKLLLIRPSSNQPEQIYNGFERFISTVSINSGQQNYSDPIEPKKGEVYFVLDDRSLIQLIKKINTANLTIGKDVGIIAYNDSLLKEVVGGGITTISTDFKEMGIRMAEMINSDSFYQFENQNNIILRKSL